MGARIVSKQGFSSERSAFTTAIVTAPEHCHPHGKGAFETRKAKRACKSCREQRKPLRAGNGQ
ncbi:hypothetical protein E2C01_075261 [Portunus trituberculatus]|uniref:Uncharacterized protein n=1 Tax=Portunus trituberculatus TaxID=210409 RepID=A0A5B7IEM2_PORTR|nr:hypothetical protein [Portunus trituberculatus]